MTDPQSPEPNSTGAASTGSSSNGPSAKDPNSHSPRSVEPSRRDRYKPVEFISLSLVISLFGGLVAFGTTRDLVLSLVGMGIVFILTLVTIALLILAIKPDEQERSDLNEQNRGH